MRKKIQVLSALLLFFAAVSAQKNAKVIFKSTDKSIVFAPVIAQLTSAEKYMFTLPNHLTYYYSRPELLNGIFTTTNAIGIKAKYNDATPDYIFEIQMNGIENITAAPNRWHRDNYDGPRGFVKDITYNFPCSLIVKKVEGKEIKEIRKIEIYKSDALFTATYEGGFFTGVFAPYVNQGTLDSSFAHNRDEIFKKLEGRVASSAYMQICQSLVYLFNEYSTSKMTYSYAGIKDKKRSFDFNDMDTAMENFRTALDLYYDESQPKAKQIFTKLANQYETVLSSNQPRLDMNVKDMLRFNLSYCNMYLGDFTKAWDYYNKAKMDDIGPGLYYKRELAILLGIYQVRNLMENSK